MFSPCVLTVAALLGLASNVRAQCINNVAAYNPNVRTQTSNLTVFMIPVPIAAALTVLNETYPLQNLSLLDVPTSDTSLFPNGFPEGMHPAFAVITLTDDIRMSALQIDGPLMSSSVFLGYVSQDGGPAALSVPLNTYIAGPTGPLPQGLVPAVASALLFAGAPIRLGQFVPEGSPYESQGAGYLAAEAKWALVPNPVSGPGVYPEVADFLFSTTATSNYTAKTFKALLNQPNVLPSGMCQTNAYYFTNATASPVLRAGQVTLGPGADGAGVTTGTLMEASPDGSGVYEDMDGFSGCAQQIGYNPEDCQTAGASVDPGTLD